MHMGPRVKTGRHGVAKSKSSTLRVGTWPTSLVGSWQVMHKEGYLLLYSSQRSLLSRSHGVPSTL